MRNGNAKPSKSQALNKEQKIKRCRSGNSAPLFRILINNVKKPPCTIYTERLHFSIFYPIGQIFLRFSAILSSIPSTCGLTRLDVPATNILAPAS